MTVHRAEFESGSLVKHRYVVVLRPAPEVLPAIARCGREAGIAKPNALDRLHLTEFVTDDYETEPDGLADRMKAGLDLIRADAFDITLTRYGHQGGSLLPGKPAALRALRAQIVRAMALVGVAERADRGKFAPHLTLGYGDALPDFANRPIDPIRWRALDFVLIHSLLRLTIHREIGRWPLAEQPLLL